MMAVHELARKHKFMLLILMQLLDNDPPALPLSKDEWIKGREELGAYHTLFQELVAEDTLKFGEYMRMPHAKFLEFMEVVGPLLTKQETHLRTSIVSNGKIALGIRYCKGSQISCTFFP